MNQLDKAIDRILHTDALREAEKITGESYKEDPDTERLGFFLHMKKCRDTEALLQLSGDTTFSMRTEPYLAICESLGFKIIHTIPFVHHRPECIVNAPEAQNETQYILFREDGCLINMNTFGGDRNAATLYYNWAPEGGLENLIRREREDKVYPTQSGHWVKDTDIWCGDHDGREALKHHIMLLESYGKFVWPWVERPFNSLVHYVNYDDTKHIEQEKGFWARMAVIDEITENNVMQLPEAIRSVMPPSRR